MINISNNNRTENQNRYFVLKIFFRKSCHLLHNVEKYGTAEQPTGGNIIRRMRIACWIAKATDKHTNTLRMC